MKSYLVANNWNGRLHIDTMRSFDNEPDAIQYANDLLREEYSGAYVNLQAAMDRYIRVYLVAADSKPKRIKVKINP